MTSRPAHAPDVDVPASRTARAKGWAAPRLHLLVPVAVYVLLVLFGITTSSIGVSSLRQDPQHPTGIQLLAASSVRSDEYNTESPLWLGRIATGTGDANNPLSVSPDFFAQLPDGPVSAVVFFEGSLLSLGPWLPDAMLFAAKWWLPALLLGLGVPVWFRRVTGSLRWGYLCGLLIFFSPASAWWSWRPVNTLGFVFAACATGLWALEEYERGRRVRGVLGILLAGILLARFPSYYQPLAIIVGFPPVLATVAYLLARPGRWRRKLLGVGALAVSGALWTGALLLEALPALSAGLHTVYPGTRSESGTAVSLGHVFGATNLAWLVNTGTNPSTNATELSTSFTVLFVVLAVLLAAQPWGGTRPARAAFWTVTGIGAFWLTWCTVSWSHAGDYLPLIRWVPSGRASNAVGFIAVIAFCMFMAQWRRPARPVVAVVAAVAAGWMSAYAGSVLQQQYLPNLLTRQVWAAALITAAVVALLVWHPYKLSTIVVTVLVAAISVAFANPVLVGLGDLRDSATAKRMLAAGAGSRHDGTLWASDSQAVDALFLATGTPALSSRQQIGPAAAEWQLLDPGGAHSGAWNRGGTYIEFHWTDATSLSIDNPTADVVVISGSPCTVKKDIPALGYVVSSAPLAAPCLTKVDQLQWSGVDYSVYRAQ
jgi:hypothetical protein